MTTYALKLYVTLIFRAGGISFQAGYPALAGAHFSIWGSWKQARYISILLLSAMCDKFVNSSIQSHCGPRISRVSRATSNTESTEVASRQLCAAEVDKYNQCIFVRGLRVLERGEYTRRKLSLKASNSSDGLTEIKTPWFSRSSSSLSSSTSSLNKGGSNSEGSSQSRQNSLLVTSPTDDNQVTTPGMGSNFQSVRTPVDSLLEYILEVNCLISSYVHPIQFWVL